MRGIIINKQYWNYNLLLEMQISYVSNFLANLQTDSIKLWYLCYFMKEIVSKMNQTDSKVQKRGLP